MTSDGGAEWDEVYFADEEGQDLLMHRRHSHPITSSATPNVELEDSVEPEIAMAMPGMK